jgi:hypothetical protein
LIRWALLPEFRLADTTENELITLKEL